MKKEIGKKTVLFDLDGTLVNSLPSWVRVIDSEIKTLPHRGGKPFPETKSEILKILGPQLLRITEYGVSSEDALLFVQSIMSNMLGELSRAPLHGAVKKVLADLESLLVPMAIVSTSTTDIINQQLLRHSIKPYFSSIVGRDRVSKLKPNPESLLLALSEIGVEPSNAIMIGDSPVDVLAAKSSGVVSVLFYPETHIEYYEYQTDELESLKPDHIISDLSELTNLVK